jgi:hypothetical protein
MPKDPSLSFGRRIYLALFKVFGPADVGRSGAPAAHNPDDQTVPTGYHLESFTDERGVHHRIAVQDDADSS